MEIDALTVTYNINVAPKSSIGRIDEREVSSPEAREKIDALQASLDLMPQVDIPLQHFFAKGLYARQGVIRKGTVLVGAIKKHTHLNIIVSGDISIFTEEGEKRITGPATMTSPGGTKRVGYAHEDTVWITIVGTDATDVETAEEQVLAKTYEDYVNYCNQLRLLEA